MKSSIILKQVDYVGDIKNLDSGLFSMMLSVLLAIPIVALSLSDLQGKFFWFGGVMLLGMFLLPRVRYLLPDWVKSGRVIGEIKLTDSAIELGGEMINISGLDRIEIIHNYVRGRSVSRFAPLSNGMIQFSLKNGSQLKTITVLNTTKGERKVIQELILNWHSIGGNIEECFSNNRIKTIGLTPMSELSYSEVVKYKT